MAHTVLIVEDEADLRETLAYSLETEGFVVKAAGSGAEGLAQALTRPPPDLVLLDLMLPDLSGLEVCRRLRAEPATAAVPVIMLTAKGEEIDRVVGFEVGADDYVTKPFSARELILRMRAVLRRGEGGAAQASPRQRAFRQLEIDTEAHRVRVAGAPVELTVLEFKLLETLMARQGRVQSREQLLRDVWDIHAEITTRTVDTHIKRLRQKIGVAGAYIETLRGVGYRFLDDEDGP